MAKKKDKKGNFLNVEISDSQVITNTKKDALDLGMDLKDYVERILKIAHEKKTYFTNKEVQKAIICPNPKCRSVIIVNKSTEVADCPLCNQEITLSEMEEVNEDG